MKKGRDMSRLRILVAAPPIDVPPNPWFLVGWIIYISLFALIIVLLLRMIRNENEKMKMERKTEEKKRDIKLF